MPMQQMRFTRAEPASPAWSGSDGGSPRRVTFAAASPVLFHNRSSRTAVASPKEEEAEKENRPLLPKRSGAATTKRKKPAAAARPPARYRSGPSSVYTQPRQIVTQWPQRRPKDFVKQNIERLTGRPVYTWSGKNGDRSSSRENVFERLSAPRVSKALLRSHVLPTLMDNEDSPQPDSSPSASSLSPPRPTAVSPRLTIDPPTPDKDDSRQSATPSPGVRRQGLGWSSSYSSPQRSQRSQQSYSSRHSPSPRSCSTNRSSGQASRARRYDNYPARVFGVLDRNNEKRIGVNQILQGLRLLGLPATHNQLLNDEDKQQSYRQLESHHANQLDDILACIHDIERQEDSMIQHGLALSYDIPGTKCDLPTSLVHDDPNSVTTGPARCTVATPQNLTLPLEVVMDINLPDSDTSSSEPQYNTVTKHRDFEEYEQPSTQNLFAYHPVRTSILEGKTLQFIERRRHKFQHHRQVVESSLAETGMAQFAVIEMCVYIGGGIFDNLNLRYYMYGQAGGDAD
ncbi:unnamed protein product [Phytophthora fragariaefolia]|uniref:Unnamed protein product n=1 Tax=Phytophthora fragariaefolia TaxID=1490495 RepID=A0A9W6Y303_9STRA|nr:unnamed protein product [Phytophthora fragariaefolia]